MSDPFGEDAPLIWEYDDPSLALAEEHPFEQPPDDFLPPDEEWPEEGAEGAVEASAASQPATPPPPGPPARPSGRFGARFFLVRAFWLQPPLTNRRKGPNPPEAQNMEILIRSYIRKRTPQDPANDSRFWELAPESAQPSHPAHFLQGKDAQGLARTRSQNAVNGADLLSFSCPIVLARELALTPFAAKKIVAFRDAFLERH